MKQFTCDFDGFKRTIPAVDEALEKYNKACQNAVEEYMAVGKESGVEVLQVAAQKVADIYDNSIRRNINGAIEVFEELKANVKEAERLTTAGGAI